MINVYTGELVRLRPFASMDEGLALAREMHLGLIPGWGEQWTPLHEISRMWQPDGWMGDEVTFAVERLDSGELVGYENAQPPEPPRLRGMVSTYIRAEHRGRGFGVEAKRLAMRFLFEHYPLNCVEAITLSVHEKALRGLQLCGMREEGRLVGCTVSEGQWVDKVFFTLTREEWEARSAGVAT